MNNQTRFKISVSMRGKKKLAMHKRKISEALKNRTLSPKHRDNISKSMKNAWRNKKKNK